MSSQEREMQICGSKILEALHSLAEKCILVEVEHVKAHRTKKEQENMSQFEKFVTEGNEKADDLEKAGAMLDEGLMAAQAQAEGQVGFRGKEEREYHASNRVVCGSKIGIGV